MILEFETKEQSFKSTSVQDLGTPKLGRGKRVRKAAAPYTPASNRKKTDNDLMDELSEDSDSILDSPDEESSVVSPNFRSGAGPSQASSSRAFHMSNRAANVITPLSSRRESSATPLSFRSVPSISPNSTDFNQSNHQPLESVFGLNSLPRSSIRVSGGPARNPSGSNVSSKLVEEVNHFFLPFLI